MTTSPLFIADFELLKSRLRLTGVQEETDAEAIITEALLVVRAHFYRRLGATRIAELQAITEAENPATEDQITRSVASSSELKWVRLELLDTMPTVFMDGGGAVLKTWNEEAAFRTTTNFQINDLKLILRKQIEENLDILAGREAQGAETSVQAFDGTPDETPPRPWGSISG